MTRRHFSPLRLLDDWADLYWQRNDHFSDQARVVPSRTRIAWWCQNQIETGTAIYHVLSSDKPFPDEGDRLSRAMRAFLKTKAILCLLIGRDGGHLDDELGYARGRHAIVVCDFDFKEYSTMDGPGGSCEQVQVGSGRLFSWQHWYAFVEKESWP